MYNPILKINPDTATGGTYISITNRQRSNEIVNKFPCKIRDRPKSTAINAVLRFGNPISVSCIENHNK